jgi:hypothetical protein
VLPDCAKPILQHRVKTKKKNKRGIQLKIRTASYRLSRNGKLTG